MKKKLIFAGAGAVLAAVTVFSVCMAVSLAKFKKIIPVADSSLHFETGEEIIISEKDILIGKSDTKELYINPASLNIIVKDINKNVTWQSVFTDAQNDTEKSLLIVNYFGKDKAFKEWNSYAQVVANKSYVINRIDNGVCISMNFNEGASARFYEYLPQKMSYEHYDMFTDGLKKAKEDGTITDAQYNKYLSTLKIVYKKSKENECYNCTYVGKPPTSASNQLIETAKIVGYTTDDLTEDAKQFDFKVVFAEPAVFDINMYAYLENDELVVAVPSSEIVSENDYFTIYNIEILPNFGAVKQDEVSEGYLFIPDGSGALMKMNTYDPKVPDYIRPVYNNDWYKDFRYKPEYDTEIMMPVYASMYNEGTKNANGFMAIIESGADYCQIEAMLASNDTKGVGRLYNKVYCSYDLAQYEWVPVFGEFSDNTSTFLSVAPKTEENLVVRYVLYNDSVSYYEMATDYRKYLFGTKEGNTFANESGLYLDVYGTLSVTRRFVGIPYSSRYSMTSYEELKGILDDLSVKGANIAYLGVFDGGLNNKIMNEGKLVGKNGTLTGFNALKETVDLLGSRLYLGTDFMRVYDTSGNGFISSVHANEDYTKNAYTDYGTDVAVGKAANGTLSSMIVKPSYIIDITNDFLKNTKTDGVNYYLKDITNHYYADYGNDYISPQKAQLCINKAIENMGEKGLLALDCPRADKFTYGAVCVDIPRNSSEYASFFCTVPFMQLVLNGMCEYTTEKANNTSSSPEYFLMQALETGAEIKFMISAKSVDILRDTEYSGLYSMQYDLIKDDIKKVLSDYRTAMDIIGTSKIVDHTMVSEDVFVTEYNGGARVYTNYSGKSVIVDGILLESCSYKVVK